MSSNNCTINTKNDIYKYLFYLSGDMFIVEDLMQETFVAALVGVLVGFGFFFEHFGFFFGGIVGFVLFIGAIIYLMK